MDEKELTQLHINICGKLTDLYASKNHDYGDSFHKSFLEWGMPMACIRIGDKLNRVTALSKGKTDRALVVDESLEDTLLDLANYAIMTVMSMKRVRSNDSKENPCTTRVDDGKDVAMRKNGEPFYPVDHSFKPLI